MKVCYVMTKNWSVHDQRYLDMARTRKIDVCTIRVGLKTGILDLLRLKRELKQEKPDVIHGGWLSSSSFISALTQFHPFIIKVGGSDILLHSEKPFYKQLIKYSLKSADHIISTSEFVKKKIIRLIGTSGKNITVFPWGIDLERFNKTRTESTLKEVWQGKKIIILTRNFEKIYGIEYLLYAIPEIISEIPETRVLLCGKGSLESKFKNIVKKEKLERYVHFIGNVPNEQLPYYLNIAHVYVSPSLSDGTSVSLLEAMACELPCVVTNNPVIEEWIEDGVNGYVVSKRNSKELANKIITLLEDGEKRKIFGKRNRKIVEKRADWNKNFEKLLDIYEKCIRS
ncbi:hypothetical protein DRN58_01845 [Thermococci archaeon]|nr:MAG: hypothetical protein DRN58_01845 [Thermococci archaeon]